MTIEQKIISYLAAQLIPVPVSGSVPHPLPGEFVTVERTGGSAADLIPEAQIHVQSWSTSEASAAALCELAVAAMLASPQETEISRCALTASYNNPDLEYHRPRYSASFAVTYLI